MRWETIKATGGCPRCGRHEWESLGARVRCAPCGFAMSAAHMAALLGGLVLKRGRGRRVAVVRNLGCAAEAREVRLPSRAGGQIAPSSF